MAEIQKRGVSVGTLEIFPINEVPLTNLVCDGSVFNEELYPQLYDYLGTNVLPNYTDRVLRMAGPLAGAAGTTQEDAMQRITGSFDVRATDTAGASFVVAGAGAFTRGPSTLPNHGGSSTGTARPVDKISFDSGLSPGARVNNNESRVKAGIVVITIRAFSNIVIDGMADLSALLTAIADKLTAEAGLDNTKLMTSLRTWQQGAARDARVLHVRDQKAAGAAGGSSVTGVQVRTLNTVVVNGIAGASLAANQITLPPGVYDINATSQFFRSGFGQLSIREAGGSYLLDGPQLYSIASGDYAAVNATVKGRIQLATTTVIELALYTHSSYATGGLGASNGVNTRPSIFSDVIIERVD
ncbi:hypothetical protein GR156_03990 [Shinella zoogloeoides]|uniref:Phage tail collar domain-containing protein n=2 Tax=Shinella zoogloeoides TaxID=352475 RepID=A0A6N8TE07_SHIZO|nr:hypothetical protein [Shinella zoogloeoides]